MVLKNWKIQKSKAMKIWTKIDFEDNTVDDLRLLYESFPVYRDFIYWVIIQHHIRQLCNILPFSWSFNLQFSIN